MGIDEINAAGGINGRQIQLIVQDDKGDPTESANIARRLIDRSSSNFYQSLLPVLWL